MTVPLSLHLGFGGAKAGVTSAFSSLLSARRALLGAARARSSRARAGRRGGPCPGSAQVAVSIFLICPNL